MGEDFRSLCTLGRTGLRVSRIGLASGYGVPEAAVDFAWNEYGINYFYWGSRRGAGMAAALRRILPGSREKVVLALQTYDHLGWFMRRSVEKGLRTLGADFADVLILGWFNRPPPGRVLDAALALKEAGKVRFLAMSGHNRRTFGRLARDIESPVDIFMVRYNAAHRGAEAEIFPHLPPEPPGLTVYTATCWGRLLDPRKVRAPEEPLTSADCYRFVLSHPSVDLCMSGPRTEAELREGLKALDAGPMNEEELIRARRIGDMVHR
jgi:aryl-alcohol dehydrogenase-like predicted oxidoreductase